MKNFIDLLNNELEARKARNSAYSLRAFARDLSVSDSTLSKILSKKKDISLNLLDRFIENLKIEEEDALNYRGQHPDYYHPVDIKKFDGIDPLDVDYVLEILSKVGFIEESSLIKLSKLKEEVLKKILGFLIEHELVLKEEDGYRGRFRNTDIFGFDDVTSEDLKSYQKQLLSISKDAVDSVDIKDRSHISCLLMLDKKTISEIKEEVGKCTQRIAGIVSNSDTSNVPIDDMVLYCYQSALFPTTETRN